MVASVQHIENVTKWGLIFDQVQDFPHLPPILLTLWLRHLKTYIKASCMYLSCQLFLKTPRKKNWCCCTQKNIGKLDWMEVFSTDIHWKKSHISTMYKLYFCSQKVCWKCIFLQSENPDFFFSFSVHSGDPSWDSELSKL